MPLFKLGQARPKAKASMEDLRGKVTAAADAYYNSNPVMSDREFDALSSELRSMEVESRDALVSDQVGAPPRGALPMVRHAYPARSLDKTKDISQIVRVMSEAGTPIDPVKDIMLMWKLDGCTLQLVSEQWHSDW